MAHIYHQVLIEAPIEMVYDAVTTSKGLSSWWIKDCDAKPVVGNTNIFRRSNGIVNKMKVTDLNENEFVQWECVNEANEWSGTTIMFEISTKGDLSCLDFRHNGYSRENQFYGTCNYQWARHLCMLKEYCETGENQIHEEQERREEEQVRKAFHSGESTAL